MPENSGSPTICCATPVVNVFMSPEVKPTVLPMIASPVPTILSYPRANPIVTASG